MASKQSLFFEWQNKEQKNKNKEKKPTWDADAS